MCLECSKEPSHLDGSFEYPKHMLFITLLSECLKSARCTRACPILDSLTRDNISNYQCNNPFKLIVKTVHQYLSKVVNITTNCHNTGVDIYLYALILTDMDTIVPLNRGSYMRAHVLLILLNELGNEFQ